MAGEAVASADAVGGALHDVGVRPVGLDEVHVHGGEVRDLVPEVARERDRLQEDLRQQHRGADVQVDAPPAEARDDAGEDAEVEMGGASTAAGSQAGCMWTMSVPKATCTVAGRPSRRAAARRLTPTCGGARRSRYAPRAAPSPS